MSEFGVRVRNLGLVLITAGLASVSVSCKSLSPGDTSAVDAANPHAPLVAGAVPLGKDRPGEAFDQLSYAAILLDVVDDRGLVDYDRLRHSPHRLDFYLRTLADIDLPVYSRYEQLAILVNAYNACILKLVMDHPDISSVNAIASDVGFSGRRWRIAGRTVSLNRLEHGWIRRNYADPRLQFALTKGTMGCAPLRSEPYRGAQLQVQLDDQAKRFVQRPENLRWQPELGAILISEMLGWYPATYGTTPIQQLNSVSPWMPGGLRDAIGRDLARVKVQVQPFDWRLNEQTAPISGVAQGHTRKTR